jgi:hypothetical protein
MDALPSQFAPVMVQAAPFFECPAPWQSETPLPAAMAQPTGQFFTMFPRQSSDVSLMMTTGAAKVGQMHTAMTNVVAQQQHEAAGEDPLAYKLPGGGIEGVCV